MGSIFSDVTVIVCVAAILAIIFRLFKQPSILAYILTGVLIGPLAFITIHDKNVIGNFSDFGITLLLFSLGLELKLGELRSIGKTAILAGVGQVVCTFLVGWGVVRFLGFSGISAIYLAVGVTFSSTMIMVKILSDKKDLASLYGKLSVGMSLVQDFFAIFLLIILSGYHPELSIAIALNTGLILLLKMIIVVLIMINLSIYVLPYVIHLISRSSEVLFLFSLAWVFGIAALIASPFIGFSIDIGGFLAGIALANATENFQIVARIRPLRDFFITIFFVFLGMQLAFHNLTALIIPAILISLFVLIGKPLLLMGIMGAFGYRKRTAFFTGLDLGQISEFSLILVILGSSLKQIPESIVSLMTLVGIITFTVSTYFIENNNMIYRHFENYLLFFEWRKGKEEKTGSAEALRSHIILVGATRMGKSVLHSLEHSEQPLVVVDFDPKVIKELQEKNIHCVFGDIIDLEIQERVNLAHAKLVISTLTDLEDNMILAKATHHANQKTKIIVMAYDTEEAKLLYKEGVDYVVLPHIAGGRQIARALQLNELDRLDDLKEKDAVFL